MYDLDLCGGEASKFSIVGKLKDERKAIDLELEKFQRLLDFQLQVQKLKKFYLH